MNYSGQLDNKKRCFTFSIAGDNVDRHTFEVVRFEGEEALAALYRFELLLVSRDNDINERDIIGQAAHFSLSDGVEGGQPANYRGLVQSFAYQYQISDWALYRVTLVPKMWLLDTFCLSEVYLNKNLHEIFTTVMSNAGFTSNDFVMRIKNENAIAPTRDYICQYRETYLTFISRWAERLGIYWWYEESQGIEKIIFTDTRMTHNDETLLLNYQPAGELDAIVVQTRRLQKLELEALNLPQKIVIRDYSAHRASMEIMGTATVDPRGKGEKHIFGEHLKTNEEAAYIAKLRAEGMIAHGNIYRGSSTATGVRCGKFIEVQGHPRNRFNRRYLVTGVKHRGSQAGFLLGRLRVPFNNEASRSDDFYQAEISAVHSDMQFRPDLKNPWPKIDSLMTGFVDAEGDGKYAELNAKGEYKVQVPFDITQKHACQGSAWVRKATLYAGSGYGMHFPLLKGAEVLLGFINGDPDQMVLLAAVYNSLNQNVVNNNNQRQSRILSAGGNEFVMHDEENKQHLMLQTPTSRTWMRLGAGGHDPVRANYAFSSTSNPLMPQSGGMQTNVSAQQASQTYPESDGTCNFSDDPAKGVAITTDGQFTLNADGLIALTSNTNNINLQAQGNIVMQGSDYQKAASGDTSDTTKGKKMEYVEGGWIEGCAGLKLELYAGASTHFYGGVSANFYLGIAFNMYLMYTNYYRFRYDVSEVKIDNTISQIKASDFKLAKIGAYIWGGGAYVKDLQAQVEKTAVKVAESDAVIKQDDVKIEESGASLKSDDVSVGASQAKVENNEAVISENTVALEKYASIIQDAEIACRSGVTIFG
jgi:type VI secretion system VgrG family protein